MRDDCPASRSRLYSSFADNSLLAEIPFTMKEKKRDLIRYINPYPFIPADKEIFDKRRDEIFSIQVAGLAKRLSHTSVKRVVIGVSGGLDSTLALLVSVKTFEFLEREPSGIIAVTMPGFGTTERTYHNALALIKALGAAYREIDIKPACLQHFKDIGADINKRDTTYENIQARERTQILMDISNLENALVIGTGDLSEIALGWSTYNGDHMSMYAVNCGIPKTLIKHLVSYIAGQFGNCEKILRDILDTPISPELLPPDETGKIEQKTEEIIGAYELHDFFLYYGIRYGMPPKKVVYIAEHAFRGKYEKSEIIKWLKVFYKRFFTQQYKRSCIPDGPKVGTVALSPRGDWRMPSDAAYNAWINELEDLE